jgi:ATP-binding cassette subfamily C protein LapB
MTTTSSAAQAAQDVMTAQATDTPQPEDARAPGTGAGGQESMQTAELSAAVLKHLFDRLRYPVGLAELKAACQQAQSQASDCAPTQRLGEILRALRRRDVQAALMRWERLDRRGLPALVFHEGRWLVAANDTLDDVTLDDGQGQSLRLPATALAQCWVLWVRTQPAALPAGVSALTSKATRLVLAELLRGKRWLFDVMGATLAVNVLSVATSLFAMQVYDKVVPTLAFATLTALVVGMSIVLALDWILKHLRARILDKAAKEVDLAVSQQVFEHLLRLRLDTRPRSIGTLAAQVNGLETARAFFSSSMVFALTDLPFALLFIILIGAIGGAIGWVYLGLLPVALLVGGIAQYRLRRLYREELHRSTERHGLMVDVIQGLETVQAGSCGWRFAGHWQDASKSIAALAVRTRLITSLTSTTTATLSNVAYVLAIVVGVGLIAQGQLTIGGLIASTILGGRVIAPIAQAVQIVAQWQQVREALELVNRLLMQPVSRPEGKALLLPEGAPERLNFDGVKFSYPQAPVLRLDIASLEFKAGDRALLLGPVGSGKSTLLKVAAGLYQVSEGRVQLGSADLGEIDPQIVAQHVSYLSQDVHLFRGSLRSNLMLAAGVSDNRLLRVVEMLGLDRVSADNPRGLDMEISEGGSGLSGGQRQLAGLARLCLAQPRVWLLDEPTASLDNEAEARVIAALQALIRPEDIVLIATHRPSLLPLANRVVVLRGGRVVRDGAPREILGTTALKTPPNPQQPTSDDRAAAGARSAAHG